MGKRRIPRYQRDADGRDVSPAPPSGRIPADLSKQVLNGTLFPPLFYDDRRFVCVDCGKEDMWTAKDQQWWYEVAKGPIQSVAIRCLACRQARRARRKTTSPADNQPIRHIGTLMKLLRAEIEPAILAAGFVFEARNKPQQPGECVWIDYRRCDEVFSITYDPRRAQFVAELLEKDGGCHRVAVTAVDMPRTRKDIMATITAFSSAVNDFMARLGPTM